MKYLLILLLILVHPLHAQNSGHKDKLINELMTAPDATSLSLAIEKAKQAGLPGQMILEARFVFRVNENDIKKLAALAPELEAQLPNFSVDNTMIFAVKEDFASIVSYTKALAALQKEDTALFKKHITEAFWLSPAHAAQFAPHINDLRMKTAMAKITLDLKRTFENQKEKDTPTSLAQIAGDAPAFLLHFWSPWVQPSVLAMPEIATVSDTLIKNKIPVISFLLSGTAESRKEAVAYLADEGRTNPGAWLVDPEKSSLASLLRITSFPTVVLVDRSGQLLFNGDPSAKELWDELTRLNPEISPPTTGPVLSGSDSPDLPETTLPESSK
ncbi:MAG: hypothetical protein ACJAVK_000139 [Akkermansiaceae bacterium]|jgi:hypothetical protein